jgi:DNA polymerase-3 subunit gamma/tau
MGKVLYRKYRSKKLSEIVGQEHITETLEAALKNNQLSHAYLFTGPRGVGKTSVARILAYEVNGIPYDEDASNLDIIEIDAASNRRIDEIRQLRDRVNLAPSSAKYKVYIIDEVHMLTKEAFNALLKTLEEPPEHAIFILATTETHKLPETIISRTQQFKFRPITVPKIVSHLEEIAESENIKISSDALELIAESGDGSFRDSIGLLDQISSIGRKIERSDVELVLGIAPKEVITDIVKAISSYSVGKVQEQLEIIAASGYSVPTIVKQLNAALIKLLVSPSTGIAIEKDRILTLMKALLEIDASQDGFTSLEIDLIEAAYPIEGHTPDIVIRTPEETVLIEMKSSKIKTKPGAEEPEVKSIEKKEQVANKEEQPVEETRLTEEYEEVDGQLWLKVIDRIKSKHNTLYAVTRVAVPTFKDNTLVLKTKFSFHQRVLSDDKNRHVIAGIIKEISGKSFTITAVVDKTIEPKVDEPKIEDKVPESISNISNIFGSAEVIE